MYIQCFNKKKPWVPKVLRVSYNTAEITGRDRCYPPWVMVLAGTGAVWENPTHSIPMRNPNYQSCKPAIIVVFYHDCVRGNIYYNIW
jgi:hypothetical protein